MVRRFNPDRELYKIKYGKRDKIVLGIILLLVMISIGSTFALYQVRHTKRIIYTTVSDFTSNKDINLAILLDGKKSDKTEFPQKGTGYYFDRVECDNGSNITFDNFNWQVTITTGKQDKCVIKFVTKKTVPIVEYLEVNAPLVADNSNDANLRYTGPNPNNYIWFNCQNYYGEMNENTCERWRIIGIMNNMTIVNETEIQNQRLVKIIRADSLGNYIFGTVSNYPSSTMRANLNDKYLNSKVGLDGKSLTDDSGAMLEKVKWNLGGNATNNGAVLFRYNYERGKAVYGSNASYWNGVIGLVYQSDYGYATSGGETYDRETCINYELWNWQYAGYVTDCAYNSWLLYTNPTQSGEEGKGTPNSKWTITQALHDSVWMFGIYQTGHTGRDNKISSAYATHPTAYLKQNINILTDENDGSFEKPYHINQ